MHVYDTPDSLATNSVHQRLHTIINIIRGYYAATHG